MQAGLFKWLDNCVSSLNLFSGSGWDVWFFGNKLINKITSGSYPLALKSVYLRSYYFIHQNKPDHVGYQEAKGFYDPSTYSWEKGCITCLRNFWTPCTYILPNSTKPRCATNRSPCRDISTYLRHLSYLHPHHISNSSWRGWYGSSSCAY